VNEETQILLTEQLLGVKFPKSYHEFLSKKGYSGYFLVDGFKIFGLPSREVEYSIINATNYLRRKRENLPKSLIAISLKGDKALCLDLKKGNEEDVPLIEVDLEGYSEPKSLSKTFKEPCTSSSNKTTCAIY
jgi:hypothetical protein